MRLEEQPMIMEVLMGALIIGLLVLLGADRNGGGQVDRCFTVQRNPVINMTIVTRCRDLSQFVNAGTLPDAASSDWFCNYCLHRDGCRVAEGGSEP